MNMDLLNYIEQARKAGMGDDKIREGLLQSGWPANDITEAMMKAPTPDVSRPKPKAMMSKASFVIILSIIGIAVAGYFAGAYFMAQFQGFPLWPFEAPVAPASTFTPRPSPTPVACTEEAKLCPDGTYVGRTGPNCEFFCPGESPTTNLESAPSDWKIYRNEEYGFEFKYPGDWEYSKFQDAYYFDSPATKLEKQSSVEVPGDIILGIENNINKTSIDNFTKQYDDGWFELYKSKENLMVDGHKAIYYKDIYNNPGAVGHAPVATVFIEGDAHVIVFSMGGYEDLDTVSKINILNQILSTFKFVESTSIVDCGTISIGDASASVHLDSSGSSGSASVSFDQNSIIAKNCFEQKFNKCETAKVTSSLVNISTYYYEITGSNGNYCFVKSKFLKNPNPDWINKEMICSLDNKKDFETAVKDLSHCSGELYNLMTGR